MAWLSYKFIVLVVIAAVQCAPEGYVYPKPIIQFELPNQQSLPTYTTDGVNPNNGFTFQKTVSYSVSNEDYGYLKQYKHEANKLSDIDSNSYNEANLISNHNSQTNKPLDVAVPVNVEYVQNNELPLVNIQSKPLSNSYGANIFASDVQHNVQPLYQLQNTISTDAGSINAAPYQSEQNYVQINGIRSLGNSIGTSENVVTSVPTTQEVNIGNSIVPTFVQNNIQPINVPLEYFQPIQTNLNHRQNVQIISNNLPQTQNEPAVFRHIYFHVPPPDLENAPIVPIPSPPKKSYKILFIKVPSQESSNIAAIQRNLLNKLGPVEEKTLIYVLVKNPEVPLVKTILTGGTKPSEHEVLFVKYRGNPSPRSSDEPEQLNLNTDTNINVQAESTNGYK
ncbi:uncharacterized protein LOC126978557 [Leptidea sinapis]|uniref:uncharacterized protein LOC126978557 n=1 Tax=Leptidea sinapis TaxID=189913 RepID=UPI0021C3E046|nr:uncharacterized protein LOC126978557 [Leptidea sinapis]